MDGVKISQYFCNPLSGMFSFLTGFEAYVPALLMITPRPPYFVFNLPRVPDEPIFFPLLRLPSLRDNAIFLCLRIHSRYAVFFSRGVSSVAGFSSS